MSIKTGLDVVYIPRFKNIANKQKQNFLSKIFHPSELKKMNLDHLAGIYAAKEAVMKALGLQPGSWLEIEIKHKSNGQPFIEVSEALKIKKIEDISLSISHDHNYAIAFCVAIL